MDFKKAFDDVIETDITAVPEVSLSSNKLSIKIEGLNVLEFM